METLLAAVSLGLFAGVSPGPLMALVLTASLERGFRAGALTAIAPLLTDAPVILLSLVVLGRVPESLLSAITVAGGAFVAWIGVRTIVEARRSVAPGGAPAEPTDRRYVWRGALVNLLSPHPWIFWFTVGTPLMIERWPVAPWESIAFLAVFLGLLVGCKVVVAWATSHGRRFAGTLGHRRALVVLGALLIVFAAWLVWQGLADLLGLG